MDKRCDRLPHDISVVLITLGSLLEPRCKHCMGMRHRRILPGTPPEFAAVFIGRDYGLLSIAGQLEGGSELRLAAIDYVAKSSL